MRNDLKELAKYVYASFLLAPAEQTIEMSADYMEQAIPQSMTFEQVRDIIREAISNSNKKDICPQWFSAAIKAKRAGINAAQDIDEYAASCAPKSNGSESDDFKRNFLAMVGSALCWDNYTTSTTSNAAMHAWLVKHGIIKEQSGDMQVWKQEAEKYLAGQKKQINTLRDWMQQDKPALFDDEQLTDTAYMIWRQNRIYDICERIRTGQLSIDGFCAAINKVTPETRPAFIILTDDNYKFQIQ
jgi:hypothetical protein